MPRKRKLDNLIQFPARPKPTPPKEPDAGTWITFSMNMDGKKYYSVCDTSTAGQVASGDYVMIEALSEREKYGPSFYCGRFYIINERRCGLWLINDKLSRLKFRPQDIKIVGLIDHLENEKRETVLDFAGARNKPGEGV